MVIEIEISIDRDVEIAEPAFKITSVRDKDISETYF